MAAILCIETTTKTCAVGLCVDGHPIAQREDHSDAYSHAEQIHIFINEVIREAGLSFQGLEAVAVSGGPGSYTGLRIGVSTAKGLAYGLGIPLISVNPLEALTVQVHAQATTADLLIPMIDARRMEVFCAGFRADLMPVFATRAEVVEPHSFAEAEPFERVLYFGDGADKCEALLSSKAGFELIPNVRASVAGMAPLASRAFSERRFEDTAYFEPFYLKDFVAGKPKKA